MIAELFVTCVRLFTGVQGRWIGCEPNENQRIYFANHTSNFDFLVLWSVLPPATRLKTRPVAASDYWLKGRVRAYLAHNVFRAVLIDREKVTRTNNPMEKLIEAVKDGTSLIIFPEGGRTTDTEMRDFKSGLYRLAKAMPGVELVPVYLDNANRVLPKGEILPIPLVCSVHFGQPIQLEPDESKIAFAARARAAVEALSK